MYAKQRNLPFRQIHRKMIGILRDFVERELTDHIGPGPVTDDTVGLQLHWSIIEEFCGARQYLTHKSDAVVGLHGFDLHIHIDITGPEQELPRGCPNSANARQKRLIVSVEYQRCDDLSETSSRLRSYDRLEQINSPLEQLSGRFK